MQISGGLVVVFEGIDGVGKTTQIELTRQALEAEGWAVDVRRNLGGTPIGEALRAVIKSPLERPGLTNLYISAAIQEALAGAVAQARLEGKVILMDRGPISLATYAVYGDNLDPAVGWPYVDRGIGLIKPDLTLVYEADVATALQHAKQKPEATDYFESQPQAYFERVAQGYRAAVARYPDCIVINANRPIPAIQTDTIKQVKAALAARA